MKILFAYLLSVMCLFVAFACSDGGDDPVSPPKPTPPTPKDEITLDNSADNDLLFSDQGDSKTISFSSTGNWQASLSETRALNWVSISVKSGGKGKNSITITINANDNVEPRTAYLILKINGKSCLIITIKQMQRDALVVAKDSYNVDQKGGEIAVEVGHNVNFTTKIDVDWIKQQSSRAYQKENILFTIAENSELQNREGTITFESADGAIRQTVKVYQSTEDAIIISPLEQNFDSKEHTFDVSIKANVSYRIELDAQATWLQQITTRGITEETLHFHVDANTDVEPRETIIKVISTKDNVTEEV